MNNNLSRYAPENWLTFATVDANTKNEMSLYEYDSKFMDALQQCVPQGTYTIQLDFRPDVYSKELYGSYEYWFILLMYNNVASVFDLKSEVVLKYPSLADIENMFIKYGDK